MEVRSMRGACDVLVVGGGPAGSAAAIRLARAGAQVRLLDRARFPRPKPCGEYINPAAVTELERLGVLDRLLSLAAVVDRVVFHAPGGASLGASLACLLLPATHQTARSPAAAVAPGDSLAAPASFGMSLERERLDTALLTTAVGAGAQVDEGVFVEEPVIECGRVTGVRIRNGGVLRAAFVLAADGSRSRLSRALGLWREYPRFRKFALTAHFRGTRGVAGTLEMAARHDGYCGLAPLMDGGATAAMVVDQRALPEMGGDAAGFFDARLREYPFWPRVLVGADRSSPVRICGPIAGRSARAGVPGLLFLGDAAGFYDPFTGQGICTALWGARVASRLVEDALSTGDIDSPVAAWERARQRLRGRHAILRLIQVFLHRPALLDGAVRRLSTRPRAAHELLAVIADAAPPSQVLSARWLSRALLAAS